MISWIWLSILACGDASSEKTTQSTNTVETSSNPPSQGPMGKPKPPQHVGQNSGEIGPPNALNGPNGLPGSSPSEDLSTSWRDALAVDAGVNSTQKMADCPDADGDGFLDATVCGDVVGTDKADCDDHNSSVTPKTERYVPTSRFIMGSSSSHAGADESPVHVVHLDGYCVDVTETTVADFTEWLTENQRLPKGKDVRSLVITDGTIAIETGRDAHPAEGVTWAEANDFCVAKGKSLPTEAQWEKAARGGCELGDDPKKCDPSDLRAYPWGNDTPSCELANHQLSASGLPKLCVSDTQTADELPQGIGPYGHVHLAGNIWEYVADVWHPKVYSTEMRNNPTGVKTGDVHVLRGGGWNTFSTNMRAANRFHDLVMGSASGFRCARSFVEQQYDDVEPLKFSTLSGEISSTRPLTGRALYVSAFDAEDADSMGMLIPGRSPVAELRLTPNDQTTQSFDLQLPQGTYIISAALDSGRGANKDDYVSASGSGGFGHAKQNPVTVAGPVSGVTIDLRSAPMMPNNGTMKTPPKNQRPPQIQKQQ